MNIRVLFLIVLSFVGLEMYTKENADIVKVGDVLPSFKLKTSSGDVESVDLKGKVVLINFFATWCPSCVKELPQLQKKVWNKYKDNSSFELLVIGREHSEQDLLKFTKDKYTMPFYPDEGRKTYGLFAENTIPRNYVIDKDGKVVYVLTGFSEDAFNEMLSVIEDMIN